MVSRGRYTEIEWKEGLTSTFSSAFSTQQLVAFFEFAWPQFPSTITTHCRQGSLPFCSVHFYLFRPLLLQHSQSPLLYPFSSYFFHSYYLLFLSLFSMFPLFFLAFLPPLHSLFSSLLSFPCSCSSLGLQDARATSSPSARKVRGSH